MAFIRKKTIKGHDYYYLVESVRNGRIVKQKVIKYLGSKKPEAYGKGKRNLKRQE